MVWRVSGPQSDNIAYPDFLLNLDPDNKVEQLQSKQKTIFLWTGNSILDTLNSIPKGLPPPPPVAAKEDFGSIFHKTIRIHADPGYLAGQAGCLGEHVEVARGEGQRHRLVHLNCDRLLSLHANIFSTIRKPRAVNPDSWNPDFKWIRIQNFKWIRIKNFKWIRIRIRISSHWIWIQSRSGSGSTALRKNAFLSTAKESPPVPLTLNCSQKTVSLHQYHIVHLDCDRLLSQHANILPD